MSSFFLLVCLFFSFVGNQWHCLLPGFISFASEIPVCPFNFKLFKFGLLPPTVPSLGHLGMIPLLGSVTLDRVYAVLAAVLFCNA